MSISESNLKRAIRKDSELSKKLIALRKRRESEESKLKRITKKRNITTSDLQRIERYNKNLIKYEKEITKLMELIRKNTININKNKERLSKEQELEYKKMMKAVKSQTNTNDSYMNKLSEVTDKLNELVIDIKYSAQDKEIIEYDVFLSHSSLDKDVFVSEFSEKLSEKGFKVFEDVKVFKVGQSQTDMMNMGILNSRFGVVFLSANFIQSGWSEYEFKSFLNREINEKKMIILPIWHEVTDKQVRQYNPYLVDKFALKTEEFTMDEIVEHISDVILQSK